MAEPHRVLIAPERLAGWLTGFDERHGTARTVLTDTHLTLVSPDDAEADIELIWGPRPAKAMMSSTAALSTAPPWTLARVIAATRMFSLTLSRLKRRMF